MLGLSSRVSAAPPESTRLAIERPYGQSALIVYVARLHLHPCLPESGLRLLGERQRAAKLGPRRDSELWEKAVQMRTHSASRQIEPLGDLLVRESLSGQLGDLELLRS